jgi:lysine N6-hydroxylase
MNNSSIYDLIGIGIGPFNLGLAALADGIPGLKCKFFDQQPEFNWHAGLLLDNAKLQVPFFADLVTLADPCNRFSYFSFLKSRQRLFRFAIHENNFITRREYNEYCRWVIGQLKNMHFGFCCEAIAFNPDSKCYDVNIRELSSGNRVRFHAKHIVIGVGTTPSLPTCAENIKNEMLFHSADYLFRKDQLLDKRNITIIGSGQSAAEIFYDLLQHEEKFTSLNWFTRSGRFYPMDYSKLTLEMTSPDYIDYFYNLPPHKKKEVLQKQNALYKGINFSLIGEIYDALYFDNLHESKNNAGLFTNAELKKVSLVHENKFNLEFYHAETEKYFSVESEAVILATGYKYDIPSFLDPVKELIAWNADGLYNVNENYSIDKNNSIFIQNAELHSHGFNSADLGMGPYRNATIINAILGSEHFSLEKKIAFQTFGVPKGCSFSSTDSFNL